PDADGFASQPVFDAFVVAHEHQGAIALAVVHTVFGDPCLSGRRRFHGNGAGPCRADSEQTQQEDALHHRLAMPASRSLTINGGATFFPLPQLPYRWQRKVLTPCSDCAITWKIV